MNKLMLLNWEDITFPRIKFEYGYIGYTMLRRNYILTTEKPCPDTMYLPASNFRDIFYGAHVCDDDRYRVKLQDEIRVYKHGVLHNPNKKIECHRWLTILENEDTGYVIVREEDIVFQERVCMLELMREYLQGVEM